MLQGEIHKCLSFLTLLTSMTLQVRFLVAAPVPHVLEQSDLLQMQWLFDFSSFYRDCTGTCCSFKGYKLDGLTYHCPHGAQLETCSFAQQQRTFMSLQAPFALLLQSLQAQPKLNTGASAAAVHTGVAFFFFSIYQDNRLSSLFIFGQERIAG